MIHHWFNPGKIQRLCVRLLPFMVIAAVVSLGAGLYTALIVSPPDYQQGETVRIMYVHVPAAWMALSIYVMIGLLGGAYLIWKNPLSSMMAMQAAPIGAAFTLICLITGALWGKPMWGAWWVWDARLTSMLILFFFYIALLLLHRAYENRETAGKMTAILSLVGLINVPIIKFSVDWWNTLHQPASILRSGGVAIDSAMLTPLMWMGMFYLSFFLALWMLNTISALMEQKTAVRDARMSF
jgi:heme exporter protein C